MSGHEREWRGTHATMCGVGSAGSCFVPWCSCRCHHFVPEPEPVPVVELTPHEKYPEVAPFVRSMYAELEANSHKGDQAGWLLMTLRQAWQEIGWHNAKLAVAIKNNDEPLIREYAADVANGCMMLVDILNHGEVDRCPHCGWVTTADNAECAWHAMRAAKGEVPVSTLGSTVDEPRDSQ